MPNLYSPPGAVGLIENKGLGMERTYRLFHAHFKSYNDLSRSFL